MINAWEITNTRNLCDENSKAVWDIFNDTAENRMFQCLVQNWKIASMYFAQQNRTLANDRLRGGHQHRVSPSSQFLPHLILFNAQMSFMHFNKQGYCTESLISFDISEFHPNFVKRKSGISSWLSACQDYHIREVFLNSCHSPSDSCW